MAYTAKADGAWLNKTDPGGTATSNLIDAGDSNRWEANQLDAHTRLTALEAITHNTQTGTSYTLVLTDAGKIVETNNASANTLTVPPNSSVAFPVGTYLSVRQYGAGQTTLVAGSGVTLRSRGAALKLAGQYAETTLTKRATNEWVVSGEVTP